MGAFTSEPNPEHPDTLEGIRLFAVLGTSEARSVTSTEADRLLTRRIRDALDNQQGRWRMFAIDRLRGFGFRSDLF